MLSLFFVTDTKIQLKSPILQTRLKTFALFCKVIKNMIKFNNVKFLITFETLSIVHLLTNSSKINANYLSFDNLNAIFFRRIFCYEYILVLKQKLFS
jgi:hypothetical protein